ncbi:MAG: preprotein translocase subunit SecA [Candidatus Kerfeldbacteria bacterium RIFCSPLOWO2_01_FULL_48_11]|uniref:Protein translocase subunit SecA n=1 Tax=Candidatus Kerfeldbacteria bacterium RIFCSPLOWO2_01_FULL_48_11 TaxID=1798543 RepID=A0A1G2B0M7_9BACT|nr:MAG: Protein translocase subunit SecA [Parcubacteria group bacterium GW2011_GWA2_48_9]OGY82751.1 MAG: preprotein translocase subunit SecA [Candidatus Kerfeldbacteria bacterium RIFCSPLOWO2_01_FULL_48_11]
MSLYTLIFGDPNKKILSDYLRKVQVVNGHEDGLKSLSDQQLLGRFIKIRSFYTPNTSLDDLLPETFAIVREASKRVLGMRHFDMQLVGGMVLHEGKIAEMKTGEGKTLVATLPVVLNAVAGKGVHIVTVNDYLAKRDAVWMGPIYSFLGLTVGCIQHDQAFLFDPAIGDKGENAFLRPISRKEAYAADVTYGTNNEFGFDYLRDNMVPALEHEVQRARNYAIVDEVDSILIDEARTPLIISAPAQESSELYYTFSRIVSRLQEGADYNIDEKMRASTLTEEGITKVERSLGISNIYDPEGIEMVHHVEQALKAQALFKKDRDYVVKDGQVIIVDEFTGRLMHGRRYSEGLHQAIEAKEGLDVKQESRTLATITFQNFFRLYAKLSGMTGTAATEAEEFSKIYGLEVVTVPTNKPMIRRDDSDRVYKNERGKFLAIVQEIKARHEIGQPVLVGTISINKNELLADLLSREGIVCNVLNAKNHEREAQIIAQAGKKGAVTVATNMAGRGVDIVLGGSPQDKTEAEEVKKLGGLHVLGTERHESRRIDNQLRGRSGRQGDSGSSQFYVSMEDDLLRIFGSDRMKRLMDRMGVPDDMPIENAMISRSIESAQKKVEGHNFDIRKHLVEYDDVINKHRDVIYKLRRNIIVNAATGTPEAEQEMKSKILGMVESELNQIVSFHTSTGDEGTWDMEEVYESVDTIFPVPLEVRIQLEDIREEAGDASHDAAARTKLISYLISLAHKAYDDLEKRVNQLTVLRTIERALYLRAIDALWVDHLDLMDHLRQGIGLRGYAQQDPLIEYQKEAYRLFSELMNSVQRQVVNAIYKIAQIKKAEARTPVTQAFEQGTQISKSSATQFQNSTTLPAQESTTQQQNLSVPKVGRNDPCPCGSGKKYKKCHGR